MYAECPGFRLPNTTPARHPWGVFNLDNPTPLVRFVARMFPHTLAHARSPRETKWTYDNERGGFTITTLHRILGGAQVYDSYGQKCNHRFLLNYGFAIENNQEANGFCPNEVRCGGMRRNSVLVRRHAGRAGGALDVVVGGGTPEARGHSFGHTFVTLGNAVPPPGC